MRSEGKTVLVAHWSKTMAELILSLLKELSVSAVSASTIPEAMRLFAALKPEILILGLSDGWMPLLGSFTPAQPVPEILVLTNSDKLAQQVRAMGLDNVLIEDSHESLAEGILFFFGDLTARSSGLEDTTILIVDDEAEIRNALSDFLTTRGYSVLTAENGQKALQMVDKNPSILVILLDLVMPEMGGLETLKEIKSRNKHAVVIVMTGFADREIVKQAFKLGAFDVLLKPLTLSEVEGDVLGSIASLEFRKPWRKQRAAKSQL